MKSKQRGVSGEGKPETAQIQRFQDMQLLPFQQKRPKKPLRFQRFSGQRASRAHCNELIAES
jgi:hypothetical protein